MKTYDLFAYFQRSLDVVLVLLFPYQVPDLSISSNHADETVTSVYERNCLFAFIIKDRVVACVSRNMRPDDYFFPSHSTCNMLMKNIHR